MGVTIRPHVKAHKSTALLGVQLAAGNARGVTCATAAEAYGLARCGFDDILIANEIVSRDGVELLAASARAVTGRVAVAVDGAAGVARAARAAEHAARVIDVLIDFDVGSGRCGLSVERDDFVGLARRVADDPWLRFDGLMGYTGKANYAAREERLQLASSVGRQLRRARAELERAGLPVRTVSGGSTGLWDMDQGLTEAQLGSYVLMEGRYASVGLPFEPALVCAATVISRPRHGTAVLDAGWKAVSGEYGLPTMPDGLQAKSLGDEHLICAVTGEGPPVGSVVFLLPAHLDPTVNLHDCFVAVDGRDFGEWKINLRRTGSRLRPPG